MALRPAASEHFPGLPHETGRSVRGDEGGSGGGGDGGGCEGDGGGGTAQIRSESKAQPEPAAQDPSSSATVQSLAPALAWQMASASAKV